jgi:hypothetical protein
LFYSFIEKRPGWSVKGSKQHGNAQSAGSG